jgi:glycosyltransferase involved in cell wall biosynthesis
LKPLRRVAFIGNSLPRRCGIATFTNDLHQAVTASGATSEAVIVAMNDEGGRYDYPPMVRIQVQDENIAEYERAARSLNAAKFDVVSLQHEFGIFGRDAGRRVMALLAPLNMPIVTTLHTVLEAPNTLQRRVLREIVDVSATVIVMAEKGRELLHAHYDLPAEKIEVIPHGIPDCAFSEPHEAKLRRGFAGRAVILTFGLISPNKGIEIMIEAMPAILRRRADAVYVVLGATHPHLVRREGEAYRERLQERARQLGIEAHVVFLDQFVDQVTLVDFISMCDVYVTPYLNEAQMTSGTLACSFGLGQAVVSTPYWHARELLAKGRGLLVPFADSAALGSEIAALLTDDVRRQALRRDAYAYSRSMTWQRTAERYLSAFERAIDRRNRLVPCQSVGMVAANRTPPALRLGHFLSMCDDTGLLQHASHSVPDRSHGYCVDDNARALLLSCSLTALGEQCLPETLTARLAAFVQHAWNPSTQRFRNFMSFERRWLEESGSEDCHGRTLWALGECARSDASVTRRRWAAALFAESAPSTESFRSPRAWAFTLLGLEAFRSVFADEARAIELQRLLAGRLLALHVSVETPDWVWFEEGLAYENPRLSQALIVTGSSIGDSAYLAAGLRSLDWIMDLQTAERGHFRPVGSDTFGEQHARPRAFDQQPLEATAALSACLAAWRVEGDVKWKGHAVRAFDWFFGGNDLAQPLVDLDDGSCCDGLHPARANENRGGESVVSYLLGLAEMRQMVRLGSFTRPAALRILRA